MMSCHVPDGNSSAFQQPHSGCGSCHSRCCGIPHMTALFRSPAFAKPCCSLGFANGHGDAEHVLSMQKGSRYFLDPSSPTKMSSRSTSEAFFLRPYLTREEYIYWNSHFNHTQPATWACQGCTGPLDLTSDMVYHQQNFPVSIQSVTAGMTSTASRQGSGFLAHHNHSFAECFCGQTHETEFAPVHYRPKRSEFMSKGGRKNTNYSAYRFPTHAVSKGSASDYSVKDKRFVEKSSSSKRMASSANQVEIYRKNLSRNDFNSTRSCGGQQEITSKSLRSILSEKYLCGDKSFDEIPPIVTSKAIPEGKRNKYSARSAPVVFDSTSTCGLHKEKKSSNSYPVKRKNKMDSEHRREYPQRKRLAVNDDVGGLHQAQKMNGTIDLNDCLTQYLGGSLTEDHDEHRRKTSRPQSTEKSQAYGIGDTAEMSRVVDESEKTPKVYNKHMEPGKNIYKLIKTTRPVQRKLSNDTEAENSTSFGYALDYDCLPKVVGVMSSNPDAVIPGFRKQVL